MWASTGPAPSRYCRPCAAPRGYLTNVQLSTAAPSTYRDRKVGEHLGRLAVRRAISVLTHASTTAYWDLARRTAANGFIEIDSQGRRNFIYQTTGLTGHLCVDERRTTP